VHQAEAWAVAHVASVTHVVGSVRAAHHLAGGEGDHHPVLALPGAWPVSLSVEFTMGILPP
jgi:hypothetical protein